MNKYPKPESYLDAKGKKYYSEICKHLDSVDYLSEIDSFGLSMMAQYLSMYHDAAVRVGEDGAIQVYKNGTTNVSGAFSVMKECMSQFLKYSEKFGMSPKDRERMLKFKNMKTEEDGFDAI
jgi:P27 family predicted phage terminase small subunit